jgi:DnaJ-like protein
MKMNSRDALNVFGLKSDATFELIKGAYRKASMQYHPDRNPAGLEMMKIVNAAYNALTDYVAGSVQLDVDVEESMNFGEELNAALNAIIGLGLTIEICGSWIWVSGDTKPYKEILKAAGYRWAPKKLMWSYGTTRATSRGKFSMDDIRLRHGSVSVKSQPYQRVEGV